MDRDSQPQAAASVLMVRPARFGFNPETALSNRFARAPGEGDLAARVVAEFASVVAALEAAGVEVLVLRDQPAPAKPDAIFPNNWVSFHADGTLVLYPMAAASRRHEREPGRLRDLLRSAGFAVRRTVDLTGHEDDGRFLEGTGSLILDRPRRLAFASIGPRTDRSVIAAFDAALGFETHCFDAADDSGQPIYHTNVLLSVGTEFAILCSAAVPPEQRGGLIDRLARPVIEVSIAQMRQFACNIIELRGRQGPVIAMSAAALASLTPAQRRQLEGCGNLAVAAIPTIEAVGGGSVRCMIADIHLPRAG